MKQVLHPSKYTKYPAIKNFIQWRFWNTLNVCPIFPQKFIECTGEQAVILLGAVKRKVCATASIVTIWLLWPWNTIKVIESGMNG